MEDFGLQAYEALKTQEVQQAPLREVGGIEEMAKLLLLEARMLGEQGQAVLEKVVM